MVAASSDRLRRPLLVGIGASLLFHAILVALIVLAPGWGGVLPRVKRGERRVPAPPDSPPPPAEPFEAGVVTLYRSTLRPQGAFYEPLARTVAGDAGATAPRPAAD